MKAWQCSVCKYVHKGDTPPAKCPVCGVGKEKFVEVELDEETGKPVAPSAKKPKAAPAAQAEAQPTEAKAEPEPGPAPEPETGFEKIKALSIQHHAHPVLVHTPNGLLPVSVLLFILARLFDAPLLMKAGAINMVFVFLSMPLVLYTGYLEWEKKYQKADTPIFKVKILAAALTAVACAISLIWLWISPHVLFTPQGWVFLLINVVMVAGAGIAGHIGGKLVFKD